MSVQAPRRRLAADRVADHRAPRRRQRLADDAADVVRAEDAAIDRDRVLLRCGSRPPCAPRLRGGRRRQSAKGLSILGQGASVLPVPTERNSPSRASRRGAAQPDCRRAGKQPTRACTEPRRPDETGIGLALADEEPSCRGLAHPGSPSRCAAASPMRRSMTSPWPSPGEVKSRAGTCRAANDASTGSTAAHDTRKRPRRLSPMLTGSAITRRVPLALSMRDAAARVLRSAAPASASALWRSRTSRQIAREDLASVGADRTRTSARIRHWAASDRLPPRVLDALGERASHDRTSRAASSHRCVVWCSVALDRRDRGPRRPCSASPRRRPRSRRATPATEEDSRGQPAPCRPRSAAARARPAARAGPRGDASRSCARSFVHFAAIDALSCAALQRRPGLAEAAVPRALGANSSTTRKATRATGRNTSCAMRSPGAMVKARCRAIPSADHQRPLVVRVDQSDEVAEHERRACGRGPSAEGSPRTIPGPRCGSRCRSGSSTVSPGSERQLGVDHRAQVHAGGVRGRVIRATGTRFRAARRAPASRSSWITPRPSCDAPGGNALDQQPQQVARELRLRRRAEVGLRAAVAGVQNTCSALSSQSKPLPRRRRGWRRSHRPCLRASLPRADSARPSVSAAKPTTMRGRWMRRRSRRGCRACARGQVQPEPASSTAWIFAASVRRACSPPTAAAPT